MSILREYVCPVTGNDAGEAHLPRDEPVELPDLVVVAAEQGEEARLRAGRALRPAERQLVAAAFEFLQVEDEVEQPQASPACRRS